MSDITLTAELRTELGSPASGRLRLSGRIPGVVYGKSIEATHISVDHRELRNAFNTQDKRDQEFNLVLNGTTHRVRIAELQRNPVNSMARHIDLLVL
jgi:large subunit ribosomal protein L25